MAGSLSNLAAPAAEAAAANTTAQAAPITDAFATQTAQAAATPFPIPTAGATEIASIPGSNLTGGLADGIAQGPQLASVPMNPYDIGINTTVSPADIGGMGADEFRRQGLAGGFAPSNPITFGNIGEGFKQAFSDSEAARNFLGSNKMNLAMSAAPILAASPEVNIPGTEQFIRPFSLEIDNTSGQDPYTPGSTQERRQLNYRYTAQPTYRAAQGGEVPGYAPGGLSELAKQRKSLSGKKRYNFASDRRDSSMEAAVDQNFARGGVTQPRFLSGGGDGMSDSIKANIDGVQEARLADGEFVVPADVVSHLGNGSSKAGAKKLYAMMDKIRKARTGKTKQAPEVKAERLMPA
jgi:hypothetical protein